MTCTPASGSAPGQTVVAVDTSGLAQGTHSGAVVLASPEAFNSPIQIPVTLTLQASEQAVLAVSPSSLTFAARPGDAPPGPQWLQVKNLGAGSMPFAVDCPQAWLSCTPTTGVADATITVSVDPTGLADGTYTGTLVATADAIDSPQQVTVTLIVGVVVNRPPPVPGLHAPADGALIDTPNPELTIVSVEDPDGDPVSYSIEIYVAGSGTPIETIDDIPGQADFTTAKPEEALGNGTYLWRARATDDQGLASEWSDTRSFTVEASSSGCGCSSSGRGRSGLVLLLLSLGLAVFSRRRS
jgi:MYXO-CTERM domain-containing protein